MSEGAGIIFLIILLAAGAANIALNTYMVAFTTQNGGNVPVANVGAGSGVKDDLR